MENRIKVLFLAANPKDSEYRLRIDEEVREIAERINDKSARHSIELVPAWCIRITDLQRALEAHKPHVVHFSGHGSKTNGIVLEDDQGEAITVNKKAFADLFRILKGNIRIVVLNACHSKDQAALIQKFVDFTIGMNAAIKDISAITFAAFFYQSLAFGKSVRDAFDLGINALQLGDDECSKTPKLLVRDGVDAEKAYLAPPIEDIDDTEAGNQKKADHQTPTGNVRIEQMNESLKFKNTKIKGGVNLTFGKK